MLERPLRDDRSVVVDSASLRSIGAAVAVGAWVATALDAYRQARPERFGSVLWFGLRFLLFTVVSVVLALALAWGMERLTGRDFIERQPLDGGAAQARSRLCFDEMLFVFTLLILLWRFGAPLWSWIF